MSQACLKKLIIFSIFCLIASGVTWIVMRQLQQDNNNIPPYIRECRDICGSQYPIQKNGTYSCCTLKLFCRSKQDCQKDLDAIYSYTSTIMTYLFFIFLISVFIMLCSRCLIRRNRQRRANQLYFIYDRNNHNPLLIDNRVQPSFLDQSQQQNKPNDVNQVLRDSFSVRDSQNICPVCFEAYEDSKSLMLKCGHLFHSKCIRDWTKKQSNCPLCRVNV